MKTLYPKNFIVLLLISIWGLSACDKLFELERYNLIGTGHALVSERTFIITGEIIDIAKNREVVAYGHCWSSTNPLPTIADNSNSIGRRNSGGGYINYITNLPEKQQFYLRGYFTTNKGETVYGKEVIVLATNLANSVAAVNITNNTALVLGTLSFFPDPVLNNLKDHGFVYSTNSINSLGDEGIQRIELGRLSLSRDIQIETNLTNLKTNTLYYVRPYAITQNNVVYLGREVIFRTR
ncbi:MAG: hypothetical protein NZ551_10165 [Microscillaceae bacterium]|nr:hypothetical protein [Microscillaceae bacterium]MDW8461561.1 hypothetical protein [Cytophagales bacterium]